GPALPERTSIQVEEAEASFNYLPVSAFRMAAAAGGWHSDVGSGVEGLAELEVRTDTWTAGLTGTFGDAWDDSLRAAVLGGTRNGVQARTFVSAIPQRLSIGGGVEQWWYVSHEDAGQGLDGEQLAELRARGRVEVRYWSGEGTTGQYFYDLTLSQDSVIDTHLGVSVQADYSRINGSAALRGFTQLP